MATDRISLDRISLHLEKTPEGFNLKQLYYFHAVATEGSIAAAARRLEVTQPTISEQIKNLETSLGVQLFDRRPGGLKLNSAGHRVFNHTKTVFRSVRRLIQEMNPQLALDRLTLEVGISATISRALTVKRLIPLFQMNSVAPRIRYGNYESMLQELLNGSIDILLSENEPGESESSRITLRALADSSLVVVASPKLDGEIRKIPEDLGNLPFMQYTASSRYRWDVESYFFSNGIAPHVLGETDDVVLMTETAVRGLACAIVPESVAESYLESKALIKLDTVKGAKSGIFAHFLQTNPSDVILRALDLLEKGG